MQSTWGIRGSSGQRRKQTMISGTFLNIYPHQIKKYSKAQIHVHEKNKVLEACMDVCKRRLLQTTKIVGHINVLEMWQRLIYFMLVVTVIWAWVKTTKD